MRITTITATPSTCHQTEMLLNTATRCDEKMLMRACRSRTTTKTMKISSSAAPSAKLMKPRSTPNRPERDRCERGARVVDRGDDAHEPDQVEPTGEPAPDGAAELSGPPVDAAGGRVLRHEFGHAQRDDQNRAGDDRPAPRDRDRAAVVPRLAIGREATRQDRDDRERDREVLESAPAPVQLLLVAQLGEPLLVRIVDHCRVRHCISPGWFSGPHRSGGGTTSAERP